MMKDRFVVNIPKKQYLASFLILMLFMVPLENSTGGFLKNFLKNLDEIFAFFSLFLIIQYPRYLKEIKEYRYYIYFLLWGIICTILFDRQSIRPIILDFICCAKFFFTFCGIYCWLRSNGKTEKLLQSLSIFSKIVLVILFIFSVVWLLRNKFQTGVSVLGSHPINICHISVGLISSIILNDGVKKTRLWSLLACAICLGSLTTKGAGIALLIFLICEFRSFIKRGRIIFFYLLLIIGVMLIGFDSFQMYYLNRNAARSTLLRNSINLSIENKGFGYGYAMYGSSQAANNYSPLYYQLGYDARYGLSPMNPQYLTDSFWPIIFGQYGIIGFFVFIIFLYKVIAKLLQFRKTSYDIFVVTVIIWSYFVIMSTSSTSLFNPISVPYGAILAIAFVNNKVSLCNQTLANQQ